MKPKLLLRLAAVLALLSVGITTNAQIWLGQNLGSPGIAGSVTTNGDNTLTIVAGGDDIWNGSDNGYYYFTWVTGNFDARVKVVSLDTTSSSWAKTEMMVRFSDPVAGVQGSDGFIASMAAPGNSLSAANQHQYRAERSNGANNNLAGAVNTAWTDGSNWLRLTRTNHTVTMWSSPDGAAWTALGSFDTSATDYGFGTPAWPDMVTVGVAVTAHNNATTTTTVVSQPTVTTSGSLWTAPTAAGTSLDTVNASAYVGGEASFSYVATNNGAPVGFPMTYQWYKNGTAQPGVSGSAFTWLAAAADNGATVQCVGTVVGYPSISATGSVRSLSVSTSTVLITNATKVEVFAGHNRADIYSGNVQAGSTGNSSVAGKLRWYPSIEDGGGYGDNTARRYSGYIIPWVTGNYTFYVAADDDTDVWLSTDSSPAHKNIIAQEPGWSGFNNWTTNADASVGNFDPIASAQKCSDTWTNGTGNPANPAGIALTAGNLYYYEVVEHNGGGGDNVSLTAKLFDDPAPANGSPSTLTSASNNIVVITWQPTTLSFTGPGALFPTNVTVSEGQGVTFYARANTDSEFRPNYQWLLYGTNIPGATGTSYTRNPTFATDSGWPLSVVATVPGLAPVTSGTGILTIQTAVFEPGFVLNEKWLNIEDLNGVINRTLGRPADYVAAIPALEASVNNESGSTYSRKVSGFLVPVTTGNYDFYTSSDDYSALFISTDNDPAHKSEIAREDQWTNPWQWTRSDGGSTVGQKGSATWTNASGVAPYSGGIALVAGTKYYIEVNQVEGGGGDNVETAMVPHNVTPVNGQDYAPSGNLIGINAPKANYVAFTVQPTNPPPIGAGPSSSANFYAFGITDSQIPVGSIRAVNGTEVANQYVFFQWYRGSTAISGATASQLSLTGLRPSDNGATFYCQMRALGYGAAPSQHFWSNSLTATLTVTNDPTVPTITYSGYYLGTEPFSPTNWISLTFSMPLDPNTLTNPANYSVSGGVNVIGVQVSADGRHVQIAVDSAPTGTPTVTITGARTWSGVALAANTVQSHALPSNFTFRDIGADDQNTGALDPEVPSRLYVEGANAFTIAAVGSDIWNAADGFNFLYEQKTGDFDVVLRQTGYSLVDTWAKCGLMVREVIDPRDGSGGTPAQSRNWNVVNDPPALPCLRDGNGANAVEANWRTNTAISAASGNWQTNSLPTPTYPNAWVRLKRVGQTLTAYSGSDGAIWRPLGFMDCTSRTDTPQLPSTLYVGICTTGHLPINTVADPETYYNVVSVDNYNSSYVAPPPQQTLTVQHSGGNIIVSWTPGGGGTLQSSTDLVTWTDVGTANPSAAIPTTGGMMFFKVRP